MLEIIIPKDEIYNDKTNRFIEIPACTLTLEHSLISVAKWESKWKISYFDGPPKTLAQELDYVRCMAIGPVKHDYIFDILSSSNIIKIRTYINDSMTATTFNKKTNNRAKKQVVTAETIYARMFSHGIPLECQKWHLNRLLTLLRVCDLQNSPQDKTKMTKQETAAWNAQQNAARRAKANTRG